MLDADRAQILIGLLEEANQKEASHEEAADSLRHEAHLQDQEAITWGSRAHSIYDTLRRYGVCYRCGGELDDGFHCLNCGEWVPSIHPEALNE